MAPGASSVVFRTGNVLEVRKPSQDSRDEIKRGIQAVVTGEATANGANHGTRQYVGPADHIKGEERSTLAINVKIFLLERTDAASVSDAVAESLSCLGTDKLDNVHVSLPADTPETDPSVAAVWQALEGEVDAGRVASIGVADFSLEGVQWLMERARTKPTVNHVNLTSCCVMPKDLVDYAKASGISLLTHADSRDILPRDVFESAVAASPSYTSLRPRWLVRYQATYPCRGVIASKGYILMATDAA